MLRSDCRFLLLHCCQLTWHPDPSAALLHDSRGHRPLVKQRGWLRSLLLKLELKLLQLRIAEFLRSSHRPLLELTFLNLELSDSLSVIELISSDIQFIQPIIFVNHLQNRVIFRKQDDFTTIFWILDIAGRLLDLSSEDCLAI